MLIFFFEFPPWVVRDYHLFLFCFVVYNNCMVNFSSKQIDTIRRPFKDNALEVLEGTPRSGKTTALVFRLARYLIETEDENHLIIAFSQEQAYKLIIECDCFGLKHIFNGCCQLKDDRFGAHLQIQTPKGIRRVYYKGGGSSTSYKSFQGLSLGSVTFCEIDLLPIQVIQEALRRTFASQLRVHFADLNPPSPQHPVIKEVFEVQPTIWTHWTMEDNPILSKERKEELYRVLSKNPFLLERDWFGHRCIPQGVIYSMFDYHENIVKEIPDDEYKLELYFSGDGGLQDATSIQCNIVTRDKKGIYKLYNVNEYWYSGRETGQVKAMSIQAKEIATNFIPYCLNKWGMNYSECFIDPACRVLREELELNGIHTRGADNNASDIHGNSKGLKVGIERLQGLISSRQYKVVESEEWGHYSFLQELGLYVVDQHGNPVDMYNHSMDACRYGSNYFFKQYIRTY